MVWLASTRDGCALRKPAPQHQRPARLRQKQKRRKGRHEETLELLPRPLRREIAPPPWPRNSVALAFGPWPARQIPASRAVRSPRSRIWNQLTAAPASPAPGKEPRSPRRPANCAYRATTKAATPTASSSQQVYQSFVLDASFHAQLSSRSSNSTTASASAAPTYPAT